MRILKTEKDVLSFMRKLKKRAEEPPEEIILSVQKILNDVRRQGDRAVIRYTRRFDRVKDKSLRLTRKQIDAYAEQAPREVVRALKVAEKRIRRYHEKQKERSWFFDDRGARLGQIIRPIERAGVYVPGGKASYPSTVLMNVIPAQVAGVKEIAITVPTPRGEVNPSVMAAIKLLGIEEVYTIGGAQAIGALAYGTETIKKVDKIVGPGNIYVAIAKKMVFGVVDIDMFAGPSEVFVIADSTANEVFVASDLLSQAEHDEMASSVCITTSEGFAKKLQKEIKRQLARLPKKDIASSSLKNYGAIILVRTLREAVELANEIGPEHLELMVSKPEKLLEDIKNAGAVFMGQWSPEPIGDYIAGPNHTLPTSGTARFFSPLGVYDFIKRTSVLSFSKEAFKKLAPYVITLAEAEDLHAHARTIQVRMDEH